PNFLSSTTFRPRGPRVTFTAFASLFTPRSIERRASSWELMIFGNARPLRSFAVTAAAPVTPGTKGGAGAGKRDAERPPADPEHAARGQDQVLLTGVLDLGAAVLRVQHHVADLHVERDAVAVVVEPAGADGQHGALLGLLLGRVRNDNAGRGGRL